MSDVAAVPFGGHVPAERLHLPRDQLLEALVERPAARLDHAPKEAQPLAPVRSMLGSSMAHSQPAQDQPSLYGRLGGIYSIAMVVDSTRSAIVIG